MRETEYVCVCWGDGGVERKEDRNKSCSVSYEIAICGLTASYDVCVCLCQSRLLI